MCQGIAPQQFAGNEDPAQGDAENLQEPCPRRDLVVGRGRQRWGTDPEFRAYTDSMPVLVPRPPRWQGSASPVHFVLDFGLDLVEFILDLVDLILDLVRVIGVVIAACGSTEQQRRGHHHRREPLHP